MRRISLAIAVALNASRGSASPRFVDCFANTRSSDPQVRHLRVTQHRSPNHLKRLARREGSLVRLRRKASSGFALTIEPPTLRFEESRDPKQKR